MRNRIVFAGLLSAFLLSPAIARAEDYVITIQNNQFSPDEFIIPANQRVKVTVKNLDATPVEFESNDLKREKIIGGKGEAIIFIGPVAAGNYEYFDDFHRDTAKGTIVAK